MADEGFHLGNHPDPFDHRDFPHFSHEQAQGLSINAPSAGTAGSLTSSEPFFLADLPPVYNQLKIGSCTANSVAAALRFAHRKSTGSKYEDYEPSRLWIYYQARILANVPGLSDANEDVDDASDLSLLIQKDTGCSTRSALRCLREYGVCKESLWPYGSPSTDVDSGLFLNVDRTPNPCAPTNIGEATLQAKGFGLTYTDSNAAPERSQSQQQHDPQGPFNMQVTFTRIFDVAAKARIRSYAETSDSEWQMIYNQPAIMLLEQSLLDGYPFIFSTQLLLGARLNRSELDQNSVFVKPPTKDVVKRGRHTMLAVGYDPGRRLFLVQNSWGSKWPQEYSGTDDRLHGRFWMPYEWFEAMVDGQPITYDFWVLKLN